MKRPRWTSDEIAIARRLIDEGADDARCIAAVGRNRHACWTKLSNEANRIATFNHVSSARPKPEMLAEAAKRSMAPRTITAFLLGDPPPGCSALDQRRS